MTERFETKNVNLQAKLLKYCGVILIATSLIKIIFINKLNFRGFGQSFDSIIWLLGGSFALFISKSQNMTDRTNQFIEWHDDKVIYKLADQKCIEEIDLNLIVDVFISIDKIDLTTRDNLMHTLDISDFKDFEERKKIKSRFESFKVI